MSGNKQKFIRVYNEFRDCELSKEYYGAQTTRVRRRLRSIDVFLAVFAGSSGVLGFAVWDYTVFGVQVGQVALGVLIGVAVVLAIVKPYLKWDDQLERQSAMQGIYASLSHAHKDNVQRVKEVQDVDAISERIYEVLRALRGMHIQREDAPKDDGLTDALQEKVNKRYPKDFFYYPPNE